MFLLFIYLFYHSDCLEKLKDSLFMVGEIGGNDYNYALLQGKSIEQVKTDLVPEVVQEIARAVRVSIFKFFFSFSLNFQVYCIFF